MTEYERGHAMNLSLAMAKRIESRPTYRSAISPDQELDILTDWLSGDSQDKVAQKHKRGLDAVRKIIRKYQTAARLVLEVDRTGDNVRDDDNDAYDLQGGSVDAVDHSSSS